MDSVFQINKPMHTVYLDHNATTPIHPAVLEAMLPYYTLDFGNASSSHDFGHSAREAIDSSRQTVAAFLGASSKEIIFTGSGTESDNLAIKGAALANSSRGKHIVTSPVEHHAVLNAFKFLEKKGFEISYLDVDRFGLIDPQALHAVLRADTALVSVMHANNETGVVQPIAEIGEIARQHAVLFHTDAVQAAGKLDLDVGSHYIDLLSFSAHKMYGPKGIGALYIRAGTTVEPLFHGGHHERNIRAGTENVPGIVALGRAVELAEQEMQASNRRLELLRAKLWDGLVERIGSIQLNGHPGRRLANTLNISFDSVEADALIMRLDAEGVAVSSGAACNSGSTGPSHVLAAMGVGPRRAREAIRISLGRSNTEEDIEHTINALIKSVEEIRAL